MIFAPSNIKDFLFKPGKYFSIPEFQRPYSWTSENIRSFLEDIEQSATEPPEKKHYFGSIVFVNDAKDLNAEVIIDGQQRLTTALLMLMAIYHITSKDPAKSNISAEEVREKYLFNSASYASEENRIRLKTVTSDDKIFNKLYHQDNLTADEKQNKLFRAYAQFYDYLITQDNLDAYVNTLSKFDIVTISLNTNDDNPQRVFESINSTGQPLSSGDKIRNFALMLNSGEDQSYVYRKYWQKIEASLADPNNDYITEFFRAYIITQKNSMVPYPSVYAEFKRLFNSRVDQLQSRGQLDNFYGDIIKYLEYFCLAKFGTDTQERFGFVENFFMNMRYLQIEVFFPYAMNLLSSYDSEEVTEDEVRNSLNLVKVFFSRRIVCNIPATSIDKMFATLHRDTMEYLAAETSSYYEVLKFLLLSRGGSTKFPRDNELDFAIENNNAYGQKKSYVLYILASPSDESKESNIIRQRSDKDSKVRPLTIEHIMPQTITDKHGWKDALGGDWQRVHDSYLHKLANLTLTGYNPEYSNRSFCEKQTMKNGFKDSPLNINMQLKNITQWTETEMIARQDWWKAKLKEIWPLPTTNFKPVEIDTKVYLLDDIDLMGTKPKVLYIQGDEILVSTWASVLDSVIERVYELQGARFEQMIAEDDYLSRYISDDESRFFNPMQINDSRFYAESGSDTNKKRNIISALARKMGWTREDIAVELTAPLSNI